MTLLRVLIIATFFNPAYGFDNILGLSSLIRSHYEMGSKSGTYVVVVSHVAYLWLLLRAMNKPDCILSRVTPHMSERMFLHVCYL